MMTMTLANPSHPQKLAASPTVSAWVSASAGTGKTKVLTDRLLNLMLSGYDPSKILCLTFTKAAAAEMQERLFHRLAAWIKLDDATLHNSLADLWEGTITPDLMTRARSLFTELLDLPGGIKIQTIHGFCQSVLNRFPLEAKIPTPFSILDDAQASQILRKTTAKILKEKALDHADLFEIMAQYYKDQSFTDTLNDVLTNRDGLRQISSVSESDYTKTLRQTFDLSALDLSKKSTEFELILSFCQDSTFDRKGLLAVLQEKPNDILERWLASTPEDRATMIDEYASLYLTQRGEIAKRPKVNYEIEAERVWRLADTRKRLMIAQKSLILFVLATSTYLSYQNQKLVAGALDYDDLIDKTIGLLTDPEMAAWVLFKLDGGIDHILIDEAQDTNPAQWHVVQTLTQDFFRPDRPDRTLFVVGDSKQSIYSFHGADPQDFINLRHYFAQQSQAIGQTWRNVDLTVSFRSTPEVLAIVDRVFATDQLKHQVLAEENLIHTPFRHNHQGKVHLLPPLIKDESHENPTLDPWTLPTERRQPNSVDQDCAEKLASHIAALLTSQVILPSTNKPIEPKDILILVRQRSAFLNHLIRHLKKLNIPVAGADRLILTDHIAVQDLLSLGQFLLQPQDNLSLANVLTSPLIGLSQDQLMTLSLNRQESLWSALIHQGHTTVYGTAYQWLKAVMDQTDYLTPFDLYSFVLGQQKGKQNLLSRLGHEAEDVISAFMEVLANFDRTLPPSLELVIGELMAQDLEIKRDSANTIHNEIRLMTIHGSKGLQAPVVILVEKLSGKSQRDSVLWSLSQDHSLLLARPSQDDDTTLTRALKDQQKQADDAEDKRLLYVALTRPQDHLYVCAYGDKEKKDETSWYTLLRDNGVEQQPWQQTSALTKSRTKTIALADFLSESVDLSATLKPVLEKEESTELAHRGLIIHKLLEILPDLASDQWHGAAQRICQSLTQDQSLADECCKIALETLSRPDLQGFFKDNSVAEFEVMTQEGQLYRLDRVVFGDTIKILDYKSSKAPPGTVPAEILDQLDTYRHCISILYPDCPIECFVFWTATGRLDRVTNV
ncbi:MAG: double-strand break repair helicase AddA [Candidatus Paracaedibacteraceae bacterium]|nr:double-strand break repair helicase AddA [Candidatus Paracaedibacteraceae bacterium]